MTMKKTYLSKWRVDRVGAIPAHSGYEMHHEEGMTGIDLRINKDRDKEGNNNEVLDLSIRKRTCEVVVEQGLDLRVVKRDRDETIDPTRQCGGTTCGIVATDRGDCDTTTVVDVVGTAGNNNTDSLNLCNKLVICEADADISSHPPTPDDGNIRTVQDNTNSHRGIGLVKQDSTGALTFIHKEDRMRPSSVPYGRTDEFYAVRYAYIDSGAEQAETDLSHNTLLPLTNHRYDVPRTHSFDLRLPGSEIKISSPASNRKYTSGGSMHLNSAVSLLATDMVGVGKTEAGYPSLRVKQEVDPGLNPCNHYEPHPEYTHAHQYMTGVAQTSIPYNTEQTTYMYNHSNQHSYHDNHVDLPKVKVENVYPNPCNIPTVVTSNIPNIVTSADDECTDSGTESVNSRESSDCSKSNKDKRRPGRKKGQVSKVYHLWEFIRDVLADPRYCPTVVKWENEPDGIFRVIQSEVMASMWGAKKNNRTKMTYEKMSRSIRYSRKEGYFADLPKNKGYPKKLCFKFGEKACGWSKNYS